MYIGNLMLILWFIFDSPSLGGSQPVYVQNSTSLGFVGYGSHVNLIFKVLPHCVLTRRQFKIWRVFHTINQSIGCITLVSLSTGHSEVCSDFLSSHNLLSTPSLGRNELTPICSICYNFFGTWKEWSTGFVT